MFELQEYPVLVANACIHSTVKYLKEKLYILWLYCIFCVDITTVVAVK
jgi:hypothetical protein